MLRKVLFTILLILASNNAIAGKNFKCVVLDANILSDTGLLERNKISKIYLNREFIVDRETGKMIGEVSNTNSGFKPKVYDVLPSENGYKAITIYSPHPTVDYLQIKEYVEGREKPFFFTTGSIIMSGNCVYF